MDYYFHSGRGWGANSALVARYQRESCGCADGNSTPALACVPPDDTEDSPFEDQQEGGTATEADPAEDQWETKEIEPRHTRSIDNQRPIKNVCFEDGEVSTSSDPKRSFLYSESNAQVCLEDSFRSDHSGSLVTVAVICNKWNIGESVMDLAIRLTDHFADSTSLL